MFVLANDSILPYCLPLTRVPSVRRGDDAAEVLRQARRYRASHVLVSDDQGRRQLGYVRVIDQLLSGSRRIEAVRPLVTLTSSETVLGALIRILTRQERIALVVDAQGRSAGILRLDSLTGRLLRQS
jgi:CBS domain containing-hemolysin-like protein